MAEETLFELPEPVETKPVPATRPEQARLLRPVRNQVQWAPRDLDSMITQDHPVRVLWAVLESLNLSAFYASIKAVFGRPGHPASDPQVLLALWLYATVEGIGSARRLARLCQEHDAYRWLRGEVPINYHMLAEFRIANQEAVNNLLTEIIGHMMSEGLVTLRHVAQDGMRVRASAGAASFRRQETLDKCLSEARERVACLAKQREDPKPGVSRRQLAARERAVKERVKRVAEALENLPQVRASKDGQRRTKAKAERAEITEPRVSTTDPEARVMKMPGGGFRPAFNMELATDVDSQTVVGVGVVAAGTDSGQAVPIAEQVIQRSGKVPEGYLMDGGFVTRDEITALERKGISVYAPVREPRTTTSGRTAATPRRDDTPEVVRWRRRMNTEEAKSIYKERAATAECVNARARALGLCQLTVKGTKKALSTLLLVVIAHNLLRWIALTAQ